MLEILPLGPDLQRSVISDSCGALVLRKGNGWIQQSWLRDHPSAASKSSRTGSGKLHLPGEKPYSESLSPIMDGCKNEKIVQDTIMDHFTTTALRDVGRGMVGNRLSRTSLQTRATLGWKGSNENEAGPGSERCIFLFKVILILIVAMLIYFYE
jgi:hypothetical protein